MPPKKRAADSNGSSSSASNGDSSAPKLNRTTSDFSSTQFGCEAVTAEGGHPWDTKVSSWNVDGLRAWIKKGGLDFLEHEKPDVLCLQETKCSKEKLPDEIKVIKVN